MKGSLCLGVDFFATPFDFVHNSEHSIEEDQESAIGSTEWARLNKAIN